MSKAEMFSDASIQQTLTSDRVPQPMAAPQTHGAVPGVIRKIANSAVLLVSDIERDESQPRTHFDEQALQQLADSLKAQGQLQPILVRKKPDVPNKFILVAGERRWRAAQLADIKSLDALILDRELNEFEKLSLQYCENAIREDLNPIDEGILFSQLLQKKECSARQLARELHVDVATVTNRMKLLDLPEAIKAHVTEGRIGPVAALHLTKIEDEQEREETTEALLKGDLTATTLRQQASSKSSNKGKAKNSMKSKQWRRNGVNISVSSSKRVTYSEWASTLRAIADEVENDGRASRNKAA